jgi:ABC-type branched-subunit amino acid transport system substrate-binding protein
MLHIPYIRRLTALLLGSSLLLAACNGSNDDGASSPRVRERNPVASPTLRGGLVIGLVGTMSGPDSWRGTDAFEGADLAISQFNRRREEDEPRLELITLDDQGEAGRATELVAELTASEQTLAILYAGPPEGLPPAHDALSAADIPALLLYGDLYSAQLLDSHLFQMSPPFLWQARRVTNYLNKDRRYDLVGLVAERSSTGATAVDTFNSAFSRARGTRLTVRRYADIDDVGRVLDSLRKRRVEAIVLQGSPRLAEELLLLLQAQDSRYRGTAQARFGSLPRKARNRRKRADTWRPQVVGLDEALSARAGSVAPPGTVASDTYARGAYYLPIPSFKRFDTAFMAWWNEAPIGWEQRAYDAVRAIGLALREAGREDNPAIALERIRDARFGGLPITFGPDDHTAIGQTTVGLWVVPRGSARVRERDRLPEGMRWVPLARGFSIDGRRTDVLPEDWRHLFRKPPPPKAPAPRFSKMRFGVTTGRQDPVH